MSVKIIEENFQAMSDNPERILEYLYRLQADEGKSVDKLIIKYRHKRELMNLEKKRLERMSKYESAACEQGYTYIAGSDEVGRGSLAGPVVAAAVILPKDTFIPYLNDSKKVSKRRREELSEIIKNKASAFGIGEIDNTEIDSINILNATKKAMKIAIASLSKKPEMLLTDSVKLSGMKMSQISLIKGDSLSISIAAASIIAKVYRDNLMTELDKVYPQYSFAKHKGYGTKEHIVAIRKYGLCPIHRRSFIKRILETIEFEQLSIF
jgi:ribonuclease HII